jgi:hypothetical protein
LGEERPRQSFIGEAVFDPSRHFAALKCRSAKGSLDHLIGAAEKRQGPGSGHWRVNFAVMHNKTPIVVECGVRRRQFITVVGAMVLPIA